MRKSKQLITKSSKTKLNTILTNKLLKFQQYHQEMLVKYEFLTGKDVLPEKQLLEKVQQSRDFIIHH